MESIFSFSKVETGESTLGHSTVVILCSISALLFVIPSISQLGYSTLFGALILAGLATAVCLIDQRNAFHIPVRWGNMPMLFGLLMWTTGWVATALSRGVAGHLPIMLGLLLFGLGMLLMSWNLSSTIVWKATLVLSLAPGLLQLLAPSMVGTLSAGTQFYLMFLYSIGWVILAIQQKI